MKRILFLTDGMGLGGIEKCLYQVVNNLDKEKYKVEVCIKDSSKNQYIKDIDSSVKITYMNTAIMIKKLECKSKIVNKFTKILNKLEAKKNLKNRIKKNDIIIDFYDGNFYKYIKNIKKEKICFLHVKIDKLNTFKKGKFKKAIKSYDKFITVSKGLTQEFKDITGANANYIYNTFNLEEIEKKSYNKTELTVKEKNLLKEDYILAVSRIEDKQKDFRTLINAFKILVSNKREEKLYIAGIGPFEEELKKIVKNEGLIDKVIFLGFQKNPYIWMRNSKLFVLSSKYEGFGNVIVEALTSGTPVISSDCPSGPKEILGEEEFGLLFEVMNYRELSQKMIKLLESDKLRNFYVENGIKRSKEFSIKKVNENYKKLLEGDL